jgi:hypothetical protein
MRRLILLTAILALTGCKKVVKEQLYFDDVKPVAGVKMEVVKDINLNKPTGGEISIFIAVDPEVDRDDVDQMLRSFVRQVKSRRGFRKGNRPETIDIRLYTSKKAAEAGGDDWLARAERSSSTSEPTFTNKQKPPLLKWTKKVLKPSMAQFTGDLKPQILADPIKMTVEVDWPFVDDEGKGQYVEELSYEKATGVFYATTRELFDKIEGLTKVTFTGKHKDEVAMKIWMTRDQYVALNMTHYLETELHAFQGQFVELLASKQITEKEVIKKTRKRRRKVFRAIFARLPKEQVQLIEDLQ